MIGRRKWLVAVALNQIKADKCPCESSLQQANKNLHKPIIYKDRKRLITL